MHTEALPGARPGSLFNHWQAFNQPPCAAADTPYGLSTKGVLQGVLTGVFCTVAAAWGWWVRRLVALRVPVLAAGPPCRTPPVVGMMSLAPMVCPVIFACATTSGATIASAGGANSRSNTSRAAATRAKKPENILESLAAEAATRTAGARPATQQGKGIRDVHRTGLFLAAVVLCMHAHTKRLP